MRMKMHLGNYHFFWKPQMESFFLGKRKGFTIFNLHQVSCFLLRRALVFASLLTRQESSRFLCVMGLYPKMFLLDNKFLGRFYIVTNWFPGFLTNFSKISPKYNIYKFFFPSILLSWNSFSLAVREAQILGVPVVCHCRF